jgi:hypothetical protein
VDTDGRPHVSYHDLSNKQLKYAARTARGWAVQIVDSSGDVGRYNSLALDADGAPHIGYGDATRQAVQYATWADDRWQIETVDPSGRWGDATWLALDSQSRPHVSYSGYHTSGELAILHAQRTADLKTYLLPLVLYDHFFSSDQ